MALSASASTVINFAMPEASNNSCTVTCQEQSADDPGLGFLNFKRLAAAFINDNGWHYPPPPALSLILPCLKHQTILAL
jgi:hypothetical protein